ncbi:porin [Paraburkholderia sp. DHOC27]|uniref:porin n=1 Tax=Paraburkholderia sp. DHOC27 TaxID=2303330 RepID=UPI000E3ED58E|nr:porin [Paraburkholderia sp. DHOC27]RFU48570.1 porin [Paraburkholderia sp. DHOC27]
MKKLILTAGVGVLATAAHAQSSVTLYGLMDAGVSYVSNAANNKGGSSHLFKFDDGVTQGNRWGLRGTEDLGGGLRAIFILENGFSVGTGTASQGGDLFGRQAFVGLSRDGVGALTFGRQYSFSTDYISRYAAGGVTVGNYAFRMNDVDQLTSSRINNVVKFSSADFSGLTFGAMYGFSNEAGDFAGAPTTTAAGVTTPGSSRTYSFGANYAHGSFAMGAAYTDIRYPTATSPAFPITIANVNTFGNKDLATLGVGAKYDFGKVLIFGNWTDTIFEGTQGQMSHFNNFEIDGRYMFTPALSAALAYTYSDLTGSSTGRWNQVSSILDYQLSKSTDVYIIGVYQKASGSNGNTPVQAEIGSSSSFFGNSGVGSDKQIAARIGVRHRF